MEADAEDPQDAFSFDDDEQMATQPPPGAGSHGSGDGAVGMEGTNDDAGDDVFDFDDYSDDDM